MFLEVTARCVQQVTIACEIEIVILCGNNSDRCIAGDVMQELRTSEPQIVNVSRSEFEKIWFYLNDLYNFAIVTLDFNTINLEATCLLF